MHQAFIEGEKEERFEIIKERIQEKVEKLDNRQRIFKISVMEFPKERSSETRQKL